MLISLDASMHALMAMRSAHSLGSSRRGIEALQCNTTVAIIAGSPARNTTSYQRLLLEDCISVIPSPPSISPSVSAIALITHS